MLGLENNLKMQFMFLFPYIFPFILMLWWRQRTKDKPLWRWIVALILGEVLTPFVVSFMWLLERYQTFTSLVVALEKLNLILIIVTVFMVIEYYLRSRCGVLLW